MVDQTWEDINKVLADDLYELYFDGVNIGKHCFRFAYVGLKGDWPFLRKAMKLATGFRSKHICHFCRVTAAQLV